ncbi:MAG: hypothetical protein D6812_00275 [Deltaproteobacteria bacterium]|nr:MAG: hypothetical protein D6812_00275 [Deltaproteobacteria bacterium]
MSTDTFLLHLRQAYEKLPEHNRVDKEVLRCIDKLWKVVGPKQWPPPPEVKVCLFCQARSDEVPWDKNTTRCKVCARAILRVGICEHCGRIKNSDPDRGPTCFHCRLPDHKVRVFLTESAPPRRTRVVWRGIKEGRIDIGGAKFVVKKIPLEVTLPTPLWLRVRR